MILHKISHSPFESQALRQCLTRMHREDAVLLTEDAVYALQAADLTELKLQEVANLYALEDDIKARGVESPLMNCKHVSYHDMVVLCLDYSHVIAW